MAALKAGASWHEVIVVDDGSSDDTAARAAEAGAIVVRHPYNKGNGAAVKSGVRRATGANVLIVDGDGQHRPGDAQRLVVQAGRVRPGDRRPLSATQATAARRIGNAALNWLASYLTERQIPDLTSGFRAARRECLLEFLHLLPNGFSTPTTTTLAFLKAGYSVAFEPIDAEQRVGSLEDQVRARRREVLPDPAEDHHHLQPAEGVRADQRRDLRRRGRSTRCGRSGTQSHVTNSSVLLIMLAVVIFLVGLVSEQISALRFESRQ